MKLIIVIALILSTCSLNQKQQVSPDEFISINKNRNFSIFQNWKIYPREVKGDVLICDFYKEDEVNKRYLVFKSKSGDLIYKNIYPVMDTVIHSLGKGDTTKGKVDLELINTFNELNVNKLTHVANLNLYIFDLQETSVIYSEREIDITDLKQYEKYTRVDSNWFYYESKR